MNPTIWCLQQPESQNATADWDTFVTSEQILCPLNEGHMRGGKRIGELKVVLQRKKTLDFIWTWGSDCLIQDNVLEAFNQAKFTGFIVKPATARFKIATLHNPPRLWEFCTTGWGGMASPESGVRLIENCPGCGHLAYAGSQHVEKMFDSKQWDGSDFFMIWPYPLFIFVTERVRECILDEKFTGVRFTRLDDVKFKYAGASPGRLHYSMPEQRAHLLGDPLGIY